MRTRCKGGDNPDNCLPCRAISLVFRYLHLPAKDVRPHKQDVWFPLTTTTTNSYIALVPHSIFILEPSFSIKRQTYLKAAGDTLLGYFADYFASVIVLPARPLKSSYEIGTTLGDCYRLIEPSGLLGGRCDHRGSNLCRDDHIG